MLILLRGFRKLSKSISLNEKRYKKILIRMWVVEGKTWFIFQGNYGRNIFIADKSTKFGRDVRCDLFTRTAAWLKILSEERVSIIIHIITWISLCFTRNNLFFLLNSNLFLNKNWIMTDRFWCDFSDTMIRLYKIVKLWK